MILLVACFLFLILILMLVHHKPPSVHLRRMPKQNYEAFCFGPLDSRINKREVAQLTGRRFQKKWDVERSNERSWSVCKCFQRRSIISHPFPKKTELVPPGTVPALPTVTKITSSPVDSPAQGKLAAHHRRCPPASPARDARAGAPLPPVARAWRAGPATGTVAILATSARYSTGSISNLNKKPVAR